MGFVREGSGRGLDPKSHGGEGFQGMPVGKTAVTSHVEPGSSVGGLHVASKEGRWCEGPIHTKNPWNRMPASEKRRNRKVSNVERRTETSDSQENSRNTLMLAGMEGKGNNMIPNVHTNPKAKLGLRCCMPNVV